MLVIDAANVIGSRPNGWWRDRPDAARRFTGEVRATVSAGYLDPPVTVVLEGRFLRGAEESDFDGVTVVHAPGEGDDTIAAIAASHERATVVTADRALAERIRADSGTVVGPRWLLDRLSHGGQDDARSCSSARVRARDVERSSPTGLGAAQKSVAPASNSAVICSATLASSPTIAASPGDEMPPWARIRW